MELDLLESLIKNNTLLRNLFNTKGSYYYNVLAKEIIIYKSMSDKEMLKLKNIIEPSNPFDTFSILEDIINIDELDPRLERIKYNLNENIYKRIGIEPDDPFSKAIFDANKTRYNILSTFEYKLRKIFNILINNHLESSDGMSKEYIERIKGIKNTINFKYNNNRFNNYDLSNTKDYVISDVYQYYLNQMIEDTIITLLKYTDEELEIDTKYADAMTLQTLLRSLLTFVDNYEYLSTICDFYDEMEKEETTAKRIVRSSIISNYEDVKLLKKTKEN